MSDKPYSGDEIQAAVKILRDDLHLAANSATLARLEAIENRLTRMPVKEMTAEEKAAEYDRIIAGGAPTPPAGGPPAPAPGAPPAGDPGAPPAGGPPPAPQKKERSPSAADANAPRSWWGIYQGQGE